MTKDLYNSLENHLKFIYVKIYIIPFIESVILGIEQSLENVL